MADDSIRSCPDGAALNIRGEHFACDAMRHIHEQSDTHDGWPHSNQDAEAIWTPDPISPDDREIDVRQIASDVEAGLWDIAGQFTCAEANAFARLLRLGGRDGGARQFLESHSLSDDDDDDPEHVQIRAALARDGSGAFSITGPAVSS